MIVLCEWNYLNLRMMKQSGECLKFKSVSQGGSSYTGQHWLQKRRGKPGCTNFYGSNASYRVSNNGSKTKPCLVTFWEYNNLYYGPPQLTNDKCTNQGPTNLLLPSLENKSNVMLISSNMIKEGFLLAFATSWTT